MSAARAHGATHIDAAGLDDDALTVWHEGHLSVRIVANGPLQIWLGGTVEEIETFLTDVRRVVTAAAAAGPNLGRDVPVPN